MTQEVIKKIFDSGASSFERCLNPNTLEFDFKRHSEYRQHIANEHAKEYQPISDFAKEVARTVIEDWGSINVDEFIEAFKNEVGRG